MKLKIHSLIIDEFLDKAEEFRKYAVSRSYEGVRNPQDGVIYPDVTIDIPKEIQEEILIKLSWVLTPYCENKHNGADIHPKVMFMRMSKAGVHVPHQAHTDKNIADYTLLIYLNKDEDCEGGTDILEHIDGQMKIHPQTQEEIDLWKQDTNVPERWSKVGFCPMKFNRAFILRSDLFHRSMPINGFGLTPEDSRLVLICFFNII